MSRAVLASVVLLAGSAVLAGSASAQAPGRGRFTMDLSTSVMALPTPGVLDFDAGWVEYPGMIVFVDSRPPRESWELRIRAGGPDMGGYGKPLDDILWRTDASMTWAPLTTADQVVLQGQGDREVTVYFRVLLGWDVDVPGTYAVDVTFTATRI